MTKILLHTCCAPCTTYVNKRLSSNGFEVEGFFYNPNICPREEYEKRLLAMESYATTAGLKVIYESGEIDLLPEDCEKCYRSRLEKTAQFAKELGFDYFSTTLLISPHQKHDLLKRMGEEVGFLFGIKFYYQDFRSGYEESRKLAKKMKLYRQKYCGCLSQT